MDINYGSSEMPRQQKLYQNRTSKQTESAHNFGKHQEGMVKKLPWFCVSLDFQDGLFPDHMVIILRSISITISSEIARQQELHQNRENHFTTTLAWGRDCNHQLPSRRAYPWGTWRGLRRALCTICALGVWVSHSPNSPSSPLPHHLRSTKLESCFNDLI
jgi:hypothetical protein